MTLYNFKQRVIQQYFNFDKDIKGIENKIESIREQFYSQSMVSRTTHTELGIYACGFCPEKQVVLLVDNIQIHESKINRIKKKQLYLNRFLDSIPLQEKQYLINKYVKGISLLGMRQVENELYDEIQEIEEAISYMEGYPVEIEIENVEVNNDNLQDEFTKILEALEV